jgi:hypothetical protein
VLRGTNSHVYVGMGQVVELPCRSQEMPPRWCSQTLLMLTSMHCLCYHDR